jgi:drug/metabolite transporter (DMT)-like permease
VGYPKESPIPAHPLRSSLALLGAATIWGLAFVAQRVSLDHFGAFTFNGLRFALGALSLVPLTFLFKPSGLSPDQASWKAALKPGLLAGVVLFIAAGLQQVGLLWTSAGKAAFLTGFYILLVPIFGMFLKRHPTPGVWVGAVLGLAGLYFLSVTEAFTVGPGDALQLLGAVFWTVHILVIDRFSPRLDPLKLSVVQFAVCSILSFAVGLPREPFSMAGLQAGLVPLLYAGFGSVGIAYTLQVVGQRGVPPGPAALILSLETVFAAIGGGLLLGEVLGPRELLGCGLMLAGMVLAQVWPVKKVLASG